MNSDIVTSMVNEMGLTPARADYLQGQQNNPIDSQLQMMDNLASQEPQYVPQQMMPPPQHQMPPQQMPYEDEDDENMSNRSYDQMPPKVEKTPMSWLDTLLMYLKTPTIVAFIFLIFSLPYTGQLITQILPQFIASNGTYLLLLKSILVAVCFSMVHLLIE